MILARAVEVSRRYGDVLALDRRHARRPRRASWSACSARTAPARRTLVNLLVGAAPAHRRPGRAVRRRPARPGQPARARGHPAGDRAAGDAAGRRGASTSSRAHFPDPLAADELLARFGLADLVRRQTGGLSGGQKRRLAVALAFVGRPRLVFLDEPTTGLDVEARHALWDGDPDVPRRRRHGAADQPLPRGDRGAGPAGGGDRAAAGCSPTTPSTAVRGLVGVRRVSLTAARPLPELPGVVGVEREGGRTHLLTADADRLVRDLVARRRAVPRPARCGRPRWRRRSSP